MKTKNSYYEDQLNKINYHSTYNPIVKIQGGEGNQQTKWFDLNYESAKVMVNKLIKEFSITIEPEKYQGYTNYQTWNVCLWLDNDQSLYNFWRGKAKVTEDYELSEELKDYFKYQDNPLSDNASMYGDILSCSLDYVNWKEVVNKLKEE